MFTRVELTDRNTPRLFLMFYIHLHLLSIAFWKLWFNLTMESFKSSCIWKHPLFCWWFSSKTEVKNNDYYVQIFLFYLLIFSHWFLKSNQISSGIIFFFFYTFYESYFFPGQTPVPPRSWLWILDLSHDPFWAIWLAEVTKSHQHHDRITHWGAVTHIWAMNWVVIETVSADGRSARPARLGGHPIWWRWHGNTKSLSKVQSSDV